MKRREAVQGIILFSLGTGILYSCSSPYQAVRDLQLDHLTPTDDELSIIDKISTIAVPLHKIAALKDHTALPFTLLMVDDLYKAADRTAFEIAYQTFDTSIQEAIGKKFSQMSIEEQVEVVRLLNDGDVILPENMIRFYQNIKSLSVQYLQSTEYIQRTVNYYEMAPGRFGGSVPIASLQNRNTI